MGEQLYRPNPDAPSEWARDRQIADLVNRGSLVPVEPDYEAAIVAAFLADNELWELSESGTRLPISEWYTFQQRFLERAGGSDE